MRNEVIIVGAGPTGMVLALWLNKLGVTARVFDKAPGPGTTSRATAVQARTLELYEQLDLTNAVVERGKQIHQSNLWVNGERKAEITLGDFGKGVTPYPFLLIYPQDRHERLLVERLTSAGVHIERNTEVLGFEDHGTYVSVRFRDGDGREGTAEASYLIGCDGAHSIVRNTLGLDFPGGTYEKLFYVADVQASGPLVDGQIHVGLEQSDFLAVLNYAEQGLIRLIGTVNGAENIDPKALQFEDVSHQALTSLKVDVEKVNWFSVYRVHHRVASTFRKGRALIAGDAGHIHSPVGGQGMNTGIGDAINLAWKLAAVLKNEATDALLDSYNEERHAFAKRLVETTDDIFSKMTAEGDFAQFVREDIFPVVAPVAMRTSFLQSFVFHNVSQIDINYRKSSISAGKAGKIHGGDRLPWISTGGTANYNQLPMRWNVHVYGLATPSLTEWCKRKDLPLSTFEWCKEHAEAGLEKNAAYLLRPDTYVALATRASSPEELDRFLQSKGIGPLPPLMV